MEAGFVGVDDNSLRVSKTDRLYLLRFPRDFNLSSIDGVELDLTKDVVGRVKDSTGRDFNIENDKTGVYATRNRPVVYDPLVGSGGIIRPFDATFHISMRLKTEVFDNSSLKAPTIYPAVPQKDFLQVRSLPRGSTTTLKELQKRQEESNALLSGETKLSKKHKKDKHHDKEESSSKKSRKSEAFIPAAESVPEVVEVESEEKKKKKKKKDKSNKD